MNRIQELPQSSSRLLTSSQIITSVYCVVKELVENALDSSSKNVEVKLEDYGLEKIEVKDNGSGVDKEDIQYIARPHFTSKISSYSDLEKVSTYGFRGEALGAICAVADLGIITNSNNESIGHLVDFDKDGQVISTKPFPCARGTTVTVKNLFKKIPVRKQIYRSEKRKKDDLRKVEELLIAYGIIQNDVRFALYHNKNMIWQKPSLPSTRNALIQILGKSVVDNLKYTEHFDEKSQRKIEMFLPKLEAPLTCGLPSPSRSIIAINHRPVRMKAIDKLLKEYYNKAIQNLGKACCPICFISFTVPLTEVDVNVEPNKTAVMLHNSEEILAQFSETLKSFYSRDASEITIPLENSNQGQKSNTSDFLNSLKESCEAKIQQSKLQCVPDSPASLMNNTIDKNAKHGNSVERTNSSIGKKDVNIIGTPKEPSKKKLKSTVSKDDLDNHISTIKDFFSSQDSNSVNKLTDHILSPDNGRVPTVTVEKISPMISNVCSDVSQEGNNISSGKITAFAVSTNMSSSDKFPENFNKRKRHLSESSIFAEKIFEETLKRPTLDLKDQNGDAWSRGVHPSGGLFQPVKVLQPKPVNIPETNVKENADSLKKKESCEQKKYSFERKMTAFDLFCRNNRLEIAAQNPTCSNQQIAQLLSEKWNRFSLEEKSLYKNMLDKDYKQTIKKKERLGKVLSQNLSQEKRESSPCKADKREMKPKVKQKKISYDFDQMKRAYQCQSRVNPSPEDLNLINYLAPGIWLCSKGMKLYLLNTFRLQEAVLYHRLLETFIFDCDPLDVPQTIQSSLLGEEEMEVLVHLSKLETNGGQLSNERLTANGFDIKFVRGGENEFAFEMVGITKKIAFYGISDLKEVLQHLKSKGFSAKLSECRPQKVKLYLQGEANRSLRQSPACLRTQDVEALLKQKSRLPLNYEKCIHHKPFFNELFEIKL